MAETQLRISAPIFALVILLMIGLAVVLGIWLSEKFADKDCTCTGIADSIWQYSGGVLTLSLLFFLVIMFNDPQAFVSSNIKSKKVTIVAFVLFLALSMLGWGLHGAKVGDPKCNCHSPEHMIWDITGGSLAFLFTVFIAILFLTPGFLFKNPSPPVAAKQMTFDDLFR